MLKNLMHGLLLLSDDGFRELGRYCLSGGGHLQPTLTTHRVRLRALQFLIIHPTWDNHRSNLVNVNHRLTIYQKVT